MTTVSVVIPTYNRAELLSRTITSVLDQSFQDFEVIVVDDGSIDETEAIVSEYTDDRIIYLPHEVNKGPSAARNTGVKAAEGELIAFLDSDDELKPTFLERSIETLQAESSDCAGTFVALEVYRDGEVVTHHGVTSTMSSPADLGPSVEAEARTGGLVLRASVLTDVGPFDEDIAYMDDVAYWVELLQRYYLVGIDEPLYRYYQHDDQLTGNDAEKIEGLTGFFAEYQQDLSSAYRAQYRYILGKSYLRRRNLLKAATEFWRAIVADPRWARELSHYLSSKIRPRISSAPSYVKSRLREYT